MKPTLRLFASTIALLVCGAQAQTVYRSVGPDGKVTFSDQPPLTGQAQVSASTLGGGAAAAANEALPPALRQVVTRYPVTLYTTTPCAPCDGGRALLQSRGIPFTERSVTTAQDAAALQQLAGDTSLPLLTIGSQHFKGFSDGQWTQYLDAAEYPATSVLPANYRNPPASPLTNPPKPAAPASKPVAKPQPQAPSSAPNPNNPAGITF